MNYAIIVWPTVDNLTVNRGVVYGWYESLATALNTAINIRQNGEYASAVVVKAY